jgi:hypothetical protein
MPTPLVSFSELVYFEEPARTYLVEGVEDNDSEGTDDRVFSLREHYPNAYDVNDAFIEAPAPIEEGGGGTPPTPTPPTIDSLSYAANVVTGAFTVHGGTGTIRVLRKLETTGTYGEITSADADDGGWTDSPTLDGTYYYKLTQDGVTGESAESSVSVTLTGSAPSDLTVGITDYDESIDKYTVELDWTNHGATGNNVVQRQLGSGTWSTIATLAAAENTYTTFVYGFVYESLIVRYRVYNTAASGYSNVAIL